MGWKSPSAASGLRLLAGLAAAIFLFGAVPTEDPVRIPTLDETLRYLGFDPAADRARILAGEIVARDFRETTDEEIAVALAVAVPRPLPKVVEWIRSGEGLRSDHHIVSFGILSDEPVEADFAGVSFTAAEAGEVRDLLRAENGDHFNLSPEEVRSFQGLAKEWAGRACDAVCLQAVTSRYRSMLLARARAYHARGLDGIAPYAREEARLHDPTDELRGAVASATLLSKCFPAYFQALSRYPDAGPVQTSQLLWIKQEVQGRPMFALAHRLYYERADAALITERYFFVGHTFDSMQVVLGCLPLEGTTVVFYTNRTSTPQVTGLAQATRHSIARKRVIAAVRENLTELQRRVPPSAN